MSEFVDKKFINLIAPQLERFAWKKNDLANCRCPICGDSQKISLRLVGFSTKKIIHIFIDVTTATTVVTYIIFFNRLHQVCVKNTLWKTLKMETLRR